MKQWSLSDIRSSMLTPPHEWPLETTWLIGKLELADILWKLRTATFCRQTGKFPRYSVTRPRNYLPNYLTQVPGSKAKTKWETQLQNLTEFTARHVKFDNTIASLFPKPQQTKWQCLDCYVAVPCCDFFSPFESQNETDVMNIQMQSLWPKTFETLFITNIQSKNAKITATSRKPNVQQWNLPEIFFGFKERWKHPKTSGFSHVPSSKKSKTHQSSQKQRNMVVGAANTCEMVIALKEQLTQRNVLTKETIKIAGPNFHTPFWGQLQNTLKR